MEWLFLETSEALNAFIETFEWHDAFIKEIRIFLPVHADESGVVGEGAGSTVALIVGDGEGEAWEFLFLEVREHNLNAQSCLDDSSATMNPLRNEVIWHWGGEFIRAGKVCCRRRAPEVLAYRPEYSYPNLYAEDGSVRL